MLPRTFEAAADVECTRSSTSCPWFGAPWTNVDGRSGSADVYSNRK
jgi:hypothetical protein